MLCLSYSITEMVTDKLSSFLSPSLSISPSSSAHFLWPRLSRFFLPPFEHGQRASFNRHMRDNHQRLKKRKEEKKKKGQRQLSSHGGETRESRPTTQYRKGHSCHAASFCVCIINSHFLAFPCKLVKLS